MSQYSRGTRLRLANTIFAAQSLEAAGRIAIFTLLSIMAVRLSGRDTAAGLPGTVMPLVQALFAIPVGVMMERVGRRFGLIFSYSLSAIAAAIGVYAIIQQSFPLLLVSAAFVGAGRAGAQLSRFIAGDLFGEAERGKMIGRVVFAGTIGAVLGPNLAAPASRFAESLGFPAESGVWIVGGILYALAIILTFVMLRPEPSLIIDEIQPENTPRTANESSGDGRSIREILRDTPVQLAILTTLISQTVMVTLMVITPVHMQYHDHHEAAIGFVISAHTLGMFAFSPLTGWLVDRFGRIWMMIAGAAVLIAATLIAPFSATMPFLVIGLFLLGLGWNFAFISGSSLLSDSLKGEERAKMQGTNDMIVAISSAFGSLSSGYIFEMGGYSLVAAVCLIVIVLFLFITRLLVPNLRKRKIA